MHLAFTIIRMVMEIEELMRRDPIENFEDLYRVFSVCRHGCFIACEAAEL